MYGDDSTLEEQDNSIEHDSNYWKARLALAQTKTKIQNLVEKRAKLGVSIEEKYEQFEKQHHEKQMNIERMYREAGETQVARTARKHHAEQQRQKQECAFYQRVQDDITDILGQTREEFIIEQGLEHLIQVPDEHEPTKPDRSQIETNSHQHVDTVDEKVKDGDKLDGIEQQVPPAGINTNFTSYVDSSAETIIVEDVEDGDEIDGIEHHGTLAGINADTARSVGPMAETIIVEDVEDGDELDGIEQHDKLDSGDSHSKRTLNPEAVPFQPSNTTQNGQPYQHDEDRQHTKWNFKNDSCVDDITDRQHDLETLLRKVAEVRSKAKYDVDDPRSADELLNEEIHQIYERINHTAKRWVGRKKHARKQRESATKTQLPSTVKNSDEYKKVLEARKISDYVESLKRTNDATYFHQQDISKKDRPILHQWHGDPVIQHKPDNIITLCLQNGNGLYTLPEKGKVHLMSEAMLLYDINFLGLPESHLNPSSPETADVQDVFTSYHPGGLTHHTNTKVRHRMPTKSQQGGVSTFVDSNFATKFNGVEHDPLGRWQCVNILAKESMLKIYTVYRVCKEPTGCTDSAYQDQERELNRLRIEITPDQQVVDALQEQLEKDLSNRCKIIVMADANEKVSLNNPRMHRMLQNLGLVNVIEERGDSNIPPTHQQGSGAVDHVWVTENIMPYVRRSGIAPLNFIMPSDHRAVILDIDIESICAEHIIQFTPFDRRRLKTSQAVRASKYITKLDQLFITQGIPKRALQLEEFLAKPEWTEEELKQVIELIESLDNQLCSIQLTAEKSLTAAHEIPWSPRLRNAIKLVQNCRSKFQRAKDRFIQHQSDQNEYLLRVSLVLWKEAKQELHECKENATKLREKHLTELATALHDAGIFNSIEASISSLKHIEKQKKDARINKAVLRPATHTTLSYVLIPAPDQYDPKQRHLYKQPLVIWNRIEKNNANDIKNWVAITDREELEKLLLEWQCLHFTQAHDTPLATSQWEQIIEETTSFEELETNHKEAFEKLDEITQEFLKEMYNEQEHGEVNFEDMKLSDFEFYIKNKDEKTSTSPSGRHLGHFKATQEHPIQQITFNIIRASLRAKYVPLRWRKTVTALIEKNPGSPKIHRLRTIHIVEPEVQFISNFYWSKKFLAYCELQANHITENQYGGRKGKWAHTASAKTQVMWDILKMQNIPAVTHVADARANFDRNMFHVVSKLLNSRQFPDNPTIWYKEFLKLQEFYVRSVYGVSNDSYGRSSMNRIFGDCQGLAWSAINQIIVSSAQDNIYRRHSSKFSLCDYAKEIFLESGTNYFIDDRITITILEEGQQLNQLIPTAQRNEEIQQKLINAAGGALAPGKCFIYVTARKYGDLHLGYMTEKQLPGTLILQSTDAKPALKLDRYHPKKSKRYLGSFIGPMMNPQATKAKVEEQIGKWTSRINPSFLGPDNVIQSLHTTLYKQVEWPLAGADLSYNQCDALMGKVRTVLTRKQHLHSKTATAIVHGPHNLGGVEEPHFFNLQGQAKLRLLQRHMTSHSKDTFRDALLVSFGDHMLWIGKFGNLLNLPYKKYKHLVPYRTYLISIWKYMNHSELQIDFDSLPTYDLPRENDKELIEILMELKIPIKQQAMFNRIRIELHLHSLADIVMGNGFSIYPGYLNRDPTYRESKFNWGRPEKNFPKLWWDTFYSITNNILRPFVNRTHNRLGKWIADPHLKSIAHIIDDDTLRISKDIYTKTNTGTFFKRRSATTEEQTIMHPIDVTHISEMKVQIPPPTKTGPYSPYIAEIIHQTPKLSNVPKWKRDLWGHYEVNDTVIEMLLTRLQKPYIVVSDGGEPGNKHYGTYGYVFAEERDGKIDRFYENLGYVPMNRDQKASKREEGFGMLGPISLINFVEEVAKSRDIQLSKQNIYALDNSAIANLTQSPSLPTSRFNVPHYDVISQLSHEWCSSDIHPNKLTWVRGHPERRKQEKDWTTLEKLNVYADSLCHRMYEIITTEKIAVPTIPKFYPRQRVSVRTKTRRFIKEKPSQYNMDQHFNTLKEYIMRRNTMGESTFEKIDWISIGRVFDKSPRCKRIKYTKVIHEKWITLHQQHRNQHHPTGTCALCKTCTETQQHVYSCTNQKQIEYKKTLMKQFSAALRRVQTPEYIANFFAQAMFSSHDILDIHKRVTDSAPPSLHSLIDDAIMEQTEIGWDCYRKGLVAQSWSKIMMHIMYNCSQKSWSVDLWMRSLITAILENSIALWNNRCTLLQPTKEDYLHNKRNEANKRLDFYKHPTNRHSIGLYKSLVKHTRGYFTKASLRTTVQWLANLEDAIKHTKEHIARTQTLLSKYAFTKHRSQAQHHKPQKKTQLDRVLRQPTLWSFLEYDDETEVDGAEYRPRPNPAPNINPGVT